MRRKEDNPGVSSETCEDKEVIAMKRTLVSERALSITGPFHGVHERERNGTDPGKILRQGSIRSDRLMYYFSASSVVWSTQIRDPGRMGGLYRTELRDHTGVGGTQSDPIPTEAESQCPGNCGQALFPPKERKSGKGKKILENDRLP